MPLINCPECGIKVSDSAMNCPSCGYPITRTVAYATIRFEQVALIRFDCTVVCNGKEYRCKLGDAVDIPITQPTLATFHIGGGLGTCSGTIVPNGRYSIGNRSGFFPKPIISSF